LHYKIIDSLIFNQLNQQAFMRKISLVSFIIVIALALPSCKKKSQPAAGLSDSQQTQILNNYSDILEAGYQDSYTAAVNLQTAVNAFVANPTAQGLVAAKQAWLAAREPYMQTEMSRFYGGPIDGPNGDPALNSWPVDEAYIDYLIGDPHSYSQYSTGPVYTDGIINMPTQFPVISTSILFQDNQPGGGTTDANGDNIDVSIGYHAIEFLLWGQDATPAVDKIPGQRPYTDYVTGNGGTSVNQARRCTYLQMVTNLLVIDLQDMVYAWAASQDNYRASFVANTSLGIANMFNGIGRLAKGELSTERMAVPLILHSQENEHSCFSDNTHRDLWLDMQGIVNAYNGVYIRTDGTVVSGLGLTDYVKAINPADDSIMTLKLTAAQATLQAIEDNKPFDYLIDGSNAPGNQIVQNGVNGVAAVADWVTQIAQDLKLNLVTIPPTNP
jgi:putative iron-regulated protein